MVYIIFWVLLPALAVYFRIRKKIGTGFAIGLVITSLLLGFITVNTFEEKHEDRFIRLLNESRVEEAERVLAWILQKNPENVKGIDAGRIINPVMFNRIKSRLGEKYINIAEGLMERYRVSGSLRCSDIDRGRDSLKKLEHVARLLKMADSVGTDVKSINETLKVRIEEGSRILSHKEKKCQ